MTPNDFQRFKAVMAGMGRVFGADVDSVLLDAYWLALRDWMLTEFEDAAAHLMANSQFMPKPADFNELRKAGRETAGEAFQRARQIVRSLFPREYSSHQSGDPRLDAAIRACGGYEALAMCTTENIGFFENRFREHYESITDAEDVRGALPNLTGGARLTGPQPVADGLRLIGGRG